MGASKIYLDEIVGLATNKMDDFPYIAIGDGDNPFNPNDTALNNELLRKPITNVVKNVNTGFHSGELQISLVELNGFDLSELGLFTADTGGDMGIRVLTELPLTKTSDMEIVFSVETEISAINE
jgi:hypothetical protein